jgi:hypothetical protein
VRVAVGLPVSMLAVRMRSVTELAAGSATSRCAVPEKSPNDPRTVVTMACRARIPMRVCATSTS